MVPYMLTGGSITLSYQLILDFLRHHEETNNDRPFLIDHTIALSLIGTVVGGVMGGLPRYAFTGFMVSFFLLSPMTWWFYKQGRLNAVNRPANIFYENNVS